MIHTLKVTAAFETTREVSWQRGLCVPRRHLHQDSSTQLCAPLWPHLWRLATRRVNKPKSVQDEWGGLKQADLKPAKCSLAVVSMTGLSASVQAVRRYSHLLITAVKTVQRPRVPTCCVCVCPRLSNKWLFLQPPLQNPPFVSMPTVSSRYTSCFQCF